MGGKKKTNHDNDFKLSDHFFISNISYVIMTARKKFVIDKKAAFEDCYEIYHDAKFNGSLLQLNEDL